MNEKDLEVYRYNLKASNPKALFEEYGEYFEDDRIKRIKACKNPAEIKKLVASGALLYKKLGKEKISYKENGKPFIEGAYDRFFNISHSGDYVMLAICGQEIGLDIQKRVVVKEAVIERVCSPEEQKIADPVTFNHIWAIKESYAKLTGKGISTDFKTVTFEEDEKTVQIFDNGIKKAYGVNIFSDDTYEAFVCAKNVFKFKEIIDVSF